MSRITVVSAVEFEAKPCLEYLDEIDHPYDFVEIGIGALNADCFISRNKDLFKNKDILYIGSCGIYQKQEVREPFFVNPRQVYWSPISDRFHLSESIEGIYPSFELHDVVKLKECTEVDVLCSSSISTNEQIKESYLTSIGTKQSLMIENLEMYALRHIIGNYKSICFLMSVTNSIAPTGRQQWKKNFLEAAKASKEMLKKYGLLEH